MALLAEKCPFCKNPLWEPAPSNDMGKKCNSCNRTLPVPEKKVKAPKGESAASVIKERHESTDTEVVPTIKKRGLFGRNK